MGSGQRSAGSQRPPGQGGDGGGGGHRLTRGSRGLGVGGGVLVGAAPQLGQPGPSADQPVPPGVDGLDQRGPLVGGGAGLLARAGGGPVNGDAGGGEQHGQQGDDRVLAQGPGQGAGAGGAADGQQDDHRGGQGDGEQAAGGQAGAGVVVAQREA